MAVTVAAPSCGSPAAPADHALALVRPLVAFLAAPGVCDYPHAERTCPEPVLARGRCWGDLGRCAVRIKSTGELCRRMDCRIPRHLRIQEQGVAEDDAVTGPGA